MRAERPGLPRNPGGARTTPTATACLRSPSRGADACLRSPAGGAGARAGIVRTRIFGAVALAAALTAAGCADNDACKGHSETCLSLTLYGSEGVTRADQLQVLLMRKVQPVLPMMTLDNPQDLPFKVAVLWPDGPATLSVRAMLSGQIAGVSPEFALDLRNGQHLQRKVTLYPPLPGTADVDLGASRPDMATPAMDLATTPPESSHAVRFPHCPLAGRRCCWARRDHARLASNAQDKPHIRASVGPGSRWPWRGRYADTRDWPGTGRHPGCSRTPGAWARPCERHS